MGESEIDFKMVNGLTDDDEPILEVAGGGVVEVDTASIVTCVLTTDVNDLQSGRKDAR